MKQRGLSTCEFLLGAGIVVGHNVFHVLPNEVPIVFLLGLVSVRLRNRGWSPIGLKRPSSWTRILWIALAAAALRILLGNYVIEPMGAHFWPPIKAPAEASQIAGNIKTAFLALLFVWVFAGFGEEFVYRGYLTLRGAEAGGGSTAGYWVAIVLVSVLFGYGHYYKGPTGIIDSGVAGLILATAYMISGRNLWTCILAHGFIDTVGVVFAFFGWAD